MRWGLKASFLEYVRRLGGDVMIVQPAGVAGSAFSFPIRSESASPWRAIFGGGVVLTAHGGMMRVVIAEPGLELVDDEPMLTIGLSTDPFDVATRRPIARLEFLPSSESSEVRVQPMLAWAGVGLFGDSYPEGTAFDEIVLDVTNTRSA